MKRWVFLISILLGLFLYIGIPTGGGYYSLVWKDHRFFVSITMGTILIILFILTLAYGFYYWGRVKQWWGMYHEEQRDNQLLLISLIENLAEDQRYLLHPLLDKKIQALYQKLSQNEQDRVLGLKEDQLQETKEKIALLLVKAEAARMQLRDNLRLEYLIKAVNLDRRNPLLLKLLCQGLRDLNLFDQALSVLSRLRGLQYFERKQCDDWEAEICLKRAAAATDPQNALYDYKKVIALRPGLVQGYIGLAEVFRLLGKTKQALQTLESAWFYQPHEEIMRTYLSIVEDHADKLASVKRLASFQPDSPLSYHMILYVMMDKALYADAEPLLKQLPLEKWTDVTLGLAAQLAIKQGNLNKAIDYLRQQKHAHKLN